MALRALPTSGPAAPLDDPDDKDSSAAAYATYTEQMRAGQPRRACRSGRRAAGPVPVPCSWAFQSCLTCACMCWLHLASHEPKHSCKHANTAACCKGNRSSAERWQVRFGTGQHQGQRSRAATDSPGVRPGPANGSMLGRGQQSGAALHAVRCTWPCALHLMTRARTPFVLGRHLGAGGRGAGGRQCS